jgi:hypothetical protein
MRLGNRFLHSIQSLRELIDVVLPVVTNVDMIERTTKGLVDSLGLEGTREIHPLIERLNDVYRAVGDHMGVAPDARDDDWSAKRKQLSTSLDSAMADLTASTGHDPALTRLLNRIFARPDHPVDVINRSLLPTAVTNFELLMGDLAREALRFAPQQMEVGDVKEFTLADLKNIGSIEGAVDVAISRRVESLLRSDLPAWAEWFTKRAKVDFSRLTMGWDSLNEIMQRRHAITHSGGKVDEYYRERVGTEPLPELGKDLTPDDRYLTTALDHFAVAGLLWTSVMGAKLDKDNAADVAGRLNHMMYEFMMGAGRWSAVEAVCSCVQELTDVLHPDEKTRRHFEFNRMLAQKRLFGSDFVREQATSLDVSALSGEFHLARYCLLDDVDNALATAENLLKTSDIEVFQLREWPILAELRDDSRFLSLIERPPD